MSTACWNLAKKCIESSIELVMTTDDQVASIKQMSKFIEAQGDRVLVGWLMLLESPQILNMTQGEDKIYTADYTTPNPLQTLLVEMVDELMSAMPNYRQELGSCGKVMAGIHSTEVLGAATLIQWSTPYSAYYAESRASLREELLTTGNWERVQDIVWDTLPLVLLAIRLPEGGRRVSPEIKYVLTGEAWKMLCQFSTQAEQSVLLQYEDSLPTPSAELLYGTKALPASKWATPDPDFVWIKEVVSDVIRAAKEVALVVFDIVFIALDVHLFLSSSGVVHTAYVVTYATVFYSVATEQPSPFFAFFAIGSFTWGIGSYFYTIVEQWSVARRMSSNSQIGQLLSARVGGICHHCLPTGYDLHNDFDPKFCDVSAYAHRCTKCFVRHCLTGDRPMYVNERLHHRLFHRCQHVVASDRERAKGMMANVMLTHSALVEDDSLLREYSYEAFIAHTVRAELKLLGGDIRFLPVPADQGVVGPITGDKPRLALDDSRETPASPQPDCKRFVELGTPLIPYTQADPGNPLDGIRIVVDLEKVDLRKGLAEKFEAQDALDYESKICLIDNELLRTHGIEPKAKVVIPGLTQDDISKVLVASNTHSNCIAGISNRHYAKKETCVEWNGGIFKNSVGNPSILIRRSVHAYINIIVEALMQIDETTLRRQDTQVLEIPASEVVSELHGKTLFPIHKEIGEIAPNSFTKTMIEQNFDAASGDVLQREPMTQAFVKPNEALNKVKPRLIQHKGPTGSASAALMNKSVEHMIFRLAYFVARSIKGTDHKGVNERILKFYNDFKAGGFASTDFGSFDSSITDKAVEDPKKPGLRRIIEEAVMNAIEKKFPESSDLKNTSQKRWKKSDKVKFDTLTLYTSILIRYSGDGLTSVGNYLINWTIDQVVDTIAEVCFTAWDWKDTTINEFFQAFPSFIENEETINYIVIKVKEAAEYMAETIRRESSGQHVKRPNREFIAGEGDDRAKAYLWDFIQKFELKDRKNKRSREVLGLVTAILYVSAGMSLEPQDRTGRVPPDQLIDKENRIEFTSRIYVPLSGGTQM
ncbi:unnamed protein product, partial [Symbiodinium sp. KB8]